VRVTITDRGPFSHRSRIIDLSRKAAERLDMIQDGIVPIRVEIISMPDKKQK
jgi:rare lipoprotein A